MSEKKREILFRGKRCDTHDWVYGAFCQKDCDSPFGEMVDRPSIIKYDPPCDGFWFRVDPETVGQFTGLIDNNGEKIFEGDIVDIIDETEYGVIEWLDDKAMFACHVRGYCSGLDSCPKYAISVVGNIHDNPELLKEAPNV